MTPVNQAGYFLVQTLFDLYIMTFMLRFILQLVRADYLNPLSQFIVKVTNPLVVPLRRIIPGFLGIDWATLIVLSLLSASKLSLLFFIRFSKLPDALGLVVWTCGDILSLTIYIFFFAILIQVLMSWVAPMGNPLTGVLHRITNPLMRPARKVIPVIGGFDISPIPVMIVLQLLIILIATPLVQSGLQLALAR